MKSFALCMTLLVAGTAYASAQGQNGRYCFTTRGGAENCGFQTLAQCNAARKGVTSDICRPNPRAQQPPVRR